MQPAEIARRRQAARNRPLKPYEPIHLSGARWAEGFVAGVDRALKQGWKLGAGPVQSLTPPVQWIGVSRSSDAQWHAWWPLDRLFTAHAMTGDDRYLAPARGFALDWLDRFQAPLLGLDPREAIEAALAHSETQAWYDMAVGLRLQRLAYLADVASRDEGWSDADVGRLFQAIDFHHRLMADARLFQAHNNHGIFQALGQLAAALRLPEGPNPQAADLAAGRLKACMDAHFFPSGPHREHSPGYHLTLLDTLITARDCGLTRGLDADWLVRAQAALGWMITPTGELAPVGDTDRTGPRRHPAYVERFQDAGVRAAWIGQGTPPQGMAIYADAGLVMAREGAGSQADYLFQQAGFHSRTHKHADHLTLVWHAGGAEVLADPGRYAYAGRTAVGSSLRRQGFWYDDPARIFVESSAAHNVVTVDGAHHDRSARAFGSALVGAHQGDDLLMVETAVRLAPRVDWRRMVVRGAHRFLLVIDRVRAGDGADHLFRQHFTLGPSWAATDETGRFTRPGGDLSIRTLAPGVTLESIDRGRSEPALAGWVARTPLELEPATSLSFHAQGRSALFVTLFVLGEVRDAWSQLDAGTLTGEVGWTDADGQRRLRLGRQGWRRRRVARWQGSGAAGIG